MFTQAVKNLFNKNTITFGSYVNSSGGTSISSGWACTDYIFVIGGLKVKINGAIDGSSSAGTAFYDGGKNLISFMPNDDMAESRIVPIPENAKFVRFSFHQDSANLDTYQIEYGEVSTTYEAFNPVPTLPSFRDIQKTIIKDIEVDVRNKYASNEFSAFTFPHGKNLFNPDSILLGNAINSSGVVVPSSNWKCTNFIPILGSSKLKISATEIGNSTTVGTAFYDKNKTFISFISNTDIKSANNLLTTPHNATYMRFSTNYPSYQLTQIEYGEVSTTFEAFNPMPTLPQFNKQLKVEVDKYPTGTFMPINIPHGKNLFNKDTAVDGVLINNTGREGANVEWFSSDFIPVIQNSKLKFNSLAGTFSSSAGTAFYDSDKTFMSFVSLSEINSNGLVVSVPKGAALLRFCDVGLSRKNIIQLEYGVFTTNYEEYSPIPRMPIIDNIKITNDLLPFEKNLKFK